MSKWLTVAILAILLCSCTQRGATFVVDIDGSEWGDPVEITYDNSDTVGLYSLHFMARYRAGEVETKSLPIVVTVAAPNGFYFVDTVEFNLYSGAKHLDESSMLYRIDCSFEVAAEYIFRLTPQAGVDYSGVVALGLNIE